VNGFPKALETTHSFLPFLVVAGLSIFPLTALEALVLAIPVLVAKGGASMLTWPPSNWPQLIGTFWLVLLLTSVAMLASVSQLAFIIALVRQAIRDPLTGCFSRQSGVELLELQYSLAERSGAPLAVAFLDIDHFKQVNDEYGHEVGDMVLVTAAHQISTHLRTGDILVRWGGEEFLIIMPNSGVERALVGLERLQAATLGMRPELAPLTASVGLAERIADRATDWQTLVSLSDARMYQAKENGRNRIVSCDLPIQDESFHPQ
jgi:diguanylate cyclase (GGDEF)-like protein